jgi:hypothetical protein
MSWRPFPNTIDLDAKIRQTSNGFAIDGVGATLASSTMASTYRRAPFGVEGHCSVVKIQDTIDIVLFSLRPELGRFDRQEAT